MNLPLSWVPSLARSIGTAIGAVTSSAVNNAGSVLDTIRDLADEVSNDATRDPNGSILQGNYNYKGYTFPSNLGDSSSYNGHYMMINISTNRLGKSRLPGESTLEGEVNQNALINAQYGFTKYTMYQMVDTTVILYMPNTVLFSQANHYEDISLTNIVGGLGAAAGRLISPSITAFLSTATGALQRGAQVAGAILNPMTEVLFSNTAQRQFQFEFLFAPESPEETQNLKNIIKALRFHSAPEFSGGNGELSLYWVEPSNFDISFWNRGERNSNIPRINTCVMEAIDVDYAPTGIYSTFSNGYPVSVRLTLRFREKNVIHKELVNAGF